MDYSDPELGCPLSPDRVGSSLTGKTARGISKPIFPESPAPRNHPPSGKVIENNVTGQPATYKFRLTARIRSQTLCLGVS